MGLLEQLLSLLYWIYMVVPLLLVVVQLLALTLHLVPLFLTVLLLSSLGFGANAGGGQLLQVTLVLRHGDRTPMRPLPVDPHMAALGTLGWAQLVEQGVRQQYRLGRLLRRRYGNLLARRFNVSTMRIRSTATDRTLMSALALAAGLFPDQCPPGKEDSLPACYPVPVYSKPADTDHLLKTGAPCPNYARLWRQFRHQPDGPYTRSMAEFAWLARVARENTGWPESDAPQDLPGLWKVADSVTTWQRMGLAMPTWVNQTVLDGLAELKHRKFLWRFGDTGLQSASAALLVATVLRDMRDRLAGNSSKQLQLYSAHDGAVSAFLHAFQVFNGLQPPTAACVIAELYSNGEVRLLYKNTTEPGDPHLLEVPFCPTPCPRDRLEAAMRRRGVWAETGRAMCGAEQPSDQPELEHLKWPYMSMLFFVATASVSFALLL